MAFTVKSLLQEQDPHHVTRVLVAVTAVALGHRCVHEQQGRIYCQSHENKEE